MPVPAASELVARPDRGRVFAERRVVRVADADGRGRMRFDAFARFLQDLATDDVADALGATGSWVIRRSVFEVLAWPVYGETVDLATWASGSGSRWAERRISFAGDRGGRVEGVSLWVLVDGGGRPIPLGPPFAEAYGAAVAGRVVSSRFGLPAAPAPGGHDGLERGPFPLRATDLDLLGHVNNTVAWAMLEQVLAVTRVRRPLRAEVEHRTAIDPDTVVELVHGADERGVHMWAVDAGTGATLVSALVAPRPG